MQSPYGDSWRVSETPLWRFISRNVSFALFFLIAAGLMIGVYLYFSPSSGVAEVVAAESIGSAYNAAFSKPVPAKPVQQRVAQSAGPIRIGIISGHKGFDAGAVCEDGLTEAEVNEAIASQVIARLQAAGVPADMLDEFDPRLENYTATGMVSIHADSCDYFNELATGFKIAGSSFTDSSQLSICVEGAYQTATQLPYHSNTITPHMTDYHAFREIARGVPAIIIETGFLNLDRDFLTNRQDVVAGAIAEGILCFVEDARGTTRVNVSAAPDAGSP
jgi:N-acetylmuramoyl-L-alanine amidase